MERKPSWLRIRPPSGERFTLMSRLVARRGLHTVCDSARCPNKAECWQCGTATFMVMGDVCTRNCRFCAVATGKLGVPLRADEPEALAEAVAELELSYAVITSVDRDDLPDRGAEHFARCVRHIKERNPGVRVEVLVPDYDTREIEPVLASGVDTVAHNVETIRALQSVRDARASYQRSLDTLAHAAAAGTVLVKSSILVGLGERAHEVAETLSDLRSVGCTSVVIGQYLRPTAAQIPVAEYVTPETFAKYAESARALGFTHVVSAPLARTSYHAHKAFTGASVGTCGGSP